MNKELENYLFQNIRYLGEEGKVPRDVIETMLDKGMISSPKQAWATLEKWDRKGLYEYGTCLDLGWKINEVLK